MKQPLSTLPLHIEAADRACRAHDMAGLSVAVRALVLAVPRELQFEAVAIAELARLEEPTARERWHRLVARLGPGSARQASDPLAA